jgi:hypothetical protein
MCKRWPALCPVLVATLLVACLVAATPCARAAAASRTRSTRPTASRSQLVPVWAFVDADAAVADAQVLIMADGKPVVQWNGRVAARTNAQGVAVLRLRRVPSRFEVVVRGGRANGRALTGSLRSLIGSDPDAGVIDVNPLTALVTELRRQRPGLSVSRSAGAVKRYFGVPWWANLGQDLGDGPSWFSTQAYLDLVRRYGSIDRLDRIVAHGILSRLSPSSRVPRGAALRPEGGTVLSDSGSKAIRSALFGLTAGELVVKVFKFLGGTTLGAGAHALVGGLFGGLLELAQRAGVELPPSEFEQTQQQLADLSAQLTQLQGQVANLDRRLAQTDANELLHKSDVVTAQIDHADGELSELAKLAPDNPTRKAFAAQLTTYIGEHLKDAPAFFNRHLNPTLAISYNAIKATSRALAASSRFFDVRQSDQVRAVYDYYATYQAQLTVLLTNYWNTKPETYDVDLRKSKIANIQTSVTRTQQESLKPTVPARTFIDTTTPQFMWAIPEPRVTALQVLKDNLQTSTSISLHAPLNRFDNLQMPSSRDLEILLKGAAGNPWTWLSNQLPVRPADQLIWDSSSIQRRPIDDIQVTIFDLSTGKQEQYLYRGSRWIAPAPQCFQQVYPACVFRHPRLSNFMYSKSGGLLLLRHLKPGETYWW